MNALWMADEAAKATGGTNTASWEAVGLSIDSRTLQPGDLFIAIKGPAFDGHAYVGNAFASGAAAAMVEQAYAPENAKGPLLAVPDTEEGMRSLAREARDRGNAMIVAVTGSAGKTGTKDALALVLGRQGKTGATTGNLNNHWGLPLSLARLPRDARYGVFEMGMSAPGEIAPLSEIARPDVAIITTVESAHLEFFDSEEGIADAKAEIFAGMKRNSTAILNRDNRHFDRLHQHAKNAGIGQVFTFGAHESADFKLTALDLQPTHCTVSARIPGRDVTYTLGAPGRHWALNSLAVLAAVEALGADIDAAMLDLADATPAAGRGARKTVSLDHGSFLLIDESYNASPPAVRAALSVLSGMTPEGAGRRIAVLGDMRELGAVAPEAHAGLRDAVLAAGLDRVFLVGPEMAALDRVLPEGLVAVHGDRSEDIADAVAASVRPGDVVLVKGSLGTNMKPVVQALEALGRGEGSA